jgi:hypothetical protein
MLYWAASLAACQLAAEGAITACGGLAPAALTAMGAWALWTPDDQGLTHVQNGWEAASGAVQAVMDQLDAALGPFDGAWDTDDRRAFDVWLGNFKTELGQTRDDLKSMAGTIKNLHEQLNDAQLKLFAFALVCLAMIIFYAALQATLAAPVADVLKNIQALILGISAAGTAIEIGVLAAVLHTGSKTIWPDIPGATKNANGQGAGLQDIKIDWDDTYRAQYGH